MGRILRSDGNGGIVISKGLAVTLTIITLCSVVWSISSAYVVQVAVEPFEKRVEALERISADRAVFLQQHCVNEAERFAEINRKIDLILYRVDHNR